MERQATSGSTTASMVEDKATPVLEAGCHSASEENHGMQPFEKPMVSQKTCIELPGDGHRWRKFAEKGLIRTRRMRVYFKCASFSCSGCSAKKLVDVDAEGLAAPSVKFRERHNHSAPLLGKTPRVHYVRVHLTGSQGTSAREDCTGGWVSLGRGGRDSSSGEVKRENCMGGWMPPGCGKVHSPEEEVGSGTEMQVQAHEDGKPQGQAPGCSIDIGQQHEVKRGDSRGGEGGDLGTTSPSRVQIQGQAVCASERSTNLRECLASKRQKLSNDRKPQECRENWQPRCSMLSGRMVELANFKALASYDCLNAPRPASAEKEVATLGDLPCLTAAMARDTCGCCIPSSEACFTNRMVATRKETASEGSSLGQQSCEVMGNPIGLSLIEEMTPLSYYSAQEITVQSSATACAHSSPEHEKSCTTGSEEAQHEATVWFVSALLQSFLEDNADTPEHIHCTQDAKWPTVHGDSATDESHEPQKHATMYAGIHETSNQGAVYSVASKTSAVISERGFWQPKPSQLEAKLWRELTSPGHFQPPLVSLQPIHDTLTNPLSFLGGRDTLRTADLLAPAL